MIYEDREGKRISKQRWNLLQANPEYSIVAEFEAGAHLFRVRWHGKIDTSRHVTERNPFELQGFHLGEHEGIRTVTPMTELGKKGFRIETAAISALHSAIKKYAPRSAYLNWQHEGRPLRYKGELSAEKIMPEVLKRERRAMAEVYGGEFGAWA